MDLLVMAQRPSVNFKNVSHAKLWKLHVESREHASIEVVDKIEKVTSKRIS